MVGYSLVTVEEQNSTNIIVDVWIENQLYPPLDLVAVQEVRTPQTK